MRLKRIRKPYEPALIGMGQEFRKNRTERMKTIIVNMIKNNTKDSLYAEAFFDGFSINMMYLPTKGWFKRWRYKQAFYDGHAFRLHVLATERKR